ncbi:filamentous hemagglutinin N-terminal domain-containing protein [Paraburkholderia sp. BL23I1N1]|uniref:beta strand repeat-containing protein n=1 Tax=Paraburkholderia sp. BL23I1N1 TaxID=1938802 RepID=UPI0015FFCF52|nr:filamentous hemagglutinin N-terminal domain-containing protein [Paraburkholderia sp. BL23I1N1]
MRPKTVSPLRMSAMAVAAMLVTWHIPSMAAAPAANTLPTGGTVTVGAATITQNGNTLNINQRSGSAIASFGTFSIGANAVVNVNQPGAASSFLARVTGSDPSQIYGLLKSNGTVALINQNGILVGPSGVIDVSRFIASTLNISDSDFLAGRLTFNTREVAGRVENQGVIRTANGGSVYLIGADVKNSGVITSPNGEVLLAAGQTVQLVDTGTPGVTVNVTGSNGSVTNLGNIAAEAGSIGAAAGLINNSGAINASSVVNQGGRVFLRASQNLTTTAGSNITADGAAQGGNVTLVSDKLAYLDGTISATGYAGPGGYVETSGKQSLDVVKLPTVGTGGKWFIDPYSLDVVAGGSSNASNSGNVITSTGSGSTISAGTVSGVLNSGASVVLATGADGATTGGDITVSAAINKTSGSAASLTLNADGNININAGVTSTSNTLALNLNTNANGIESGTHTVTVSNATLGLNGGALTVSDGSSASGNGNMILGSGGSFDLSHGGSVSTGNLTLLAGGTLNANASANLSIGTLTNGGTLSLSHSSMNAGSFVNTGAATFANVTGTVSNVSNQGNLSMTSGTSLAGEVFTNTGNLALDNATLSFSSFTNDTGGYLSGNGTISVASGNGVLLNNGTISPGGDGAIGSLSINGGYSQSSTGTLLIDVASASSYDTLNYSAPSLSLGGTLQTNLLGGYVPTLRTTFAVLSGPVSSTAPGVFRHVLGNVIDNNGALQMIKPAYNPSGPGLSLAMAGSETITYTGTAESIWGNTYFWSTGYFPTAIDNVVVAAGGRLAHGFYDGVDTVNSITFGAGSNLYMSGGTLNVTNLNGSGSVAVGGGVLGYTGVANLSSLSLTNGGSVVGTGSGSQLNITDSFSQNGGTISTSGDMSVTQSTGDLTVGDITARNLTLTAASGAISQEDSPLHVTQQLSTSSANGTTLTLTGNQIAGISASNVTTGDIAIVNRLDTSDTNAVNVNRIANAGGKVSVSNTGAMTVGAAGVNATGGIDLSVANTGASTDNLTLNGVLTSAGGNINSFAGNNLSVNGNVATSAPGLVTLTAVNGAVTYAAGVSITDAHGTVVPVAVVVLPVTPVTPVSSTTPTTSDSSQAVASAVTKAVTPVSNAVVQAVTSTSAVTTTVTTTTLPAVTNSSSSTEPTTVGGEPGTFGGTDMTTSSSPSVKKPAVKLYCS